MQMPSLRGLFLFMGGCRAASLLATKESNRQVIGTCELTRARVTGMCFFISSVEIYVP